MYTECTIFTTNCKTNRFEIRCVVKSKVAIIYMISGLNSIFQNAGISCKTWSSVRGNYSHNAIIAMNIKYTMNDITDMSGCLPMHYHSSVVFNTALMVSDVNTQLPVHTVGCASLTSEVEEVPIWKGIPKSFSKICRSWSIISHPGAPLQEVTRKANHLMCTVPNTPYRYEHATVDTTRGDRSGPRTQETGKERGRE